MQLKQLVLTPLCLSKADVRPDHLLLGKWILTGDRFDLKGELDVIPYHWDDRQKFHRDFLYIQSLNERVIWALAENLNRFHGTSYSTHYWRVILAPWVNLALVCLFDRWEIISSLLHAKRQWKLSLSKESTPVKVPAGFSDANEIFEQDRWNDYVFRLLLDQRNAKHADELPTRLETTPVSSFQPNIPEKNLSFSRLAQLKSMIAHLLVRLWGTVSSVTLVSANFSAKQALKICRPEHILWPHLFQKLDAEYASMAPDLLNAEWRQGALGLQINPNAQEFETFIDMNLRSMVPWLYLESFTGLTHLSAKLPWPRRPKCLVTGMGQHSNEALKVWVAATKEQFQTFKYVVAQHSWGYFFFKTDSYMALDIRIGDAFLGWGEAATKHPKAFHLPTGHIVDSALTLSHTPTGHILFTLTSFPRYAYMQSGRPIGPQSYDLVKSYKRLLNCIDQKTREEVVLRRYPVEWEYQDSRRIFEAFPDLQPDVEINIAKSIRKARLVVCDASSTVWIECLVSDVPVIGLIDRNLFVPFEEYQPLLEELIEAGLVFHNIDDAAVFLNQIELDTTRWWQDAKLKVAKDKILHEFAKTDSDWFKTWRKTLPRVMDA
ncbi:LIC12162 family protein [Alphaproteobacteria bacterium]|nr:LIC12162 family protein [Alphaproteobacteria bacterium]